MGSTGRILRSSVVRQRIVHQVMIQGTKPVRDEIGGGNGDWAVGADLTRLSLYIDLREHMVRESGLPAECSIGTLVVVISEVLAVLFLIVEADEANAELVFE